MPHVSRSSRRRIAVFVALLLLRAIPKLLLKPALRQGIIILNSDQKFE